MSVSYVCDPRYGWVAECERRVGARPMQVCHEDNLASRVADYEGRNTSSLLIEFDGSDLIIPVVVRIRPWACFFSFGPRTHLTVGLAWT